MPHSSFSSLRASVPCLALLFAACSGSASPASDANGGGATNGAANNASQGSNASNNGSSASNNGSNGGRDSGPLAEAGANGATGGEGGTKDAGMMPPGCNAATGPDVGKLGLQEVVGGQTGVVMAAQAPGSPDWYLVRRTGEILVFANGAVRGTPFLNLSSEITLGGEQDERGLLGLTFHPDYASNGLFYVMLTPVPNTQNQPNIDQVREYKRSAADVYKAEAAAVRSIVTLPASDTNHNGGTVMFGPDKLLYVGTGDGGDRCNNDQPDTPQDVGSLFGKILRLDPSKAAPFGADGNPFVNGGDARVLHYGLRNPFRFGFDRVKGDLYIGDVGQDDFEDVEFAAKDSKGLNFGWADFEGNAAGTCDAARKLRANSVHTPPIFTIDRKGNTTPQFKNYKSVIGGIVYRGTAIPKLQGAYFFGDYLGEVMGALFQCGNTTSPVTLVDKKCALVNPTRACFDAKGSAPDLGNLFAIIEGNDGEMYMVGNRTTLYKVVPN